MNQATCTHCGAVKNANAMRYIKFLYWCNAKCYRLHFGIDKG